MRIDFATLAFGYQLENGTSTPNWATSLGQGKEYKINDTPEINELLQGVVYCSVPLSYIGLKVGKGGKMYYGDNEGSPISLGSVFQKVFVNGELIPDGKYIIVVTRDDSDSHFGRLRFKYGPSNKYDDNNGKCFSNEECLALIKKHFGLKDDACWFVSEINVENQDELHFNAVFVNKEGPQKYKDTKTLHASWEPLIEKASTQGEQTRKVLGTVTTDPENIIYYGVPGVGKSWTIKNKYKLSDSNMERVVFHPDYSYSDFIGQILPKEEKGHISYSFEAGPFTRILKKAYEDQFNPYYLIIEEINRGNAPAIFGDIFQLLDRVNGESEFGIFNSDIAKEVYGDPDHEVKIPSNLSLLATMNTADQNVFTLDTAFKRRWTMKNIKNDISKCPFKDVKICGKDVSWEAFVSVINRWILKINKDTIGNDDHRLGAFFISEKELKDVPLFSEKVLMYLWNDAFKFDRSVFVDFETLEDMLDGFSANGFAIFTEDVYKELVAETTRSK